MHNGHNWGGDFALYIEQSQAMQEGKIHELYASNSYAMDHSGYAVGPYLYPFGFPLLITPVMVIVGMDFIALKWFCACFLLLSIPMMYLLFKKKSTPLVVPLFITALIALHDEFVMFCDNVLSDLPFLFFVLLSFYVIERANNLRDHSIAAVIFFFTYFIRDAGIALFPAVIVFHLFIMDKDKVKSAKKGLLLFYGLYILLFITSKILLPDGGANQMRKIVDRFSSQVVIDNLYYYTGLIMQFFKVMPMLFPIVLALIITGVVIKAKETFHYVIFLLGVFAILLIWPHFQGMRFVFPLIPFLIFFGLCGFIYWGQKLRMKMSLVVILIGIFTGNVIYKSYGEIIAFKQKDMNECYTEELIAFYDFIKKNTEVNSIIAGDKPTVLRLFTDRNSIQSDQDFFDESFADYLFLPKYLYKDSESQNLLVHESERYILVKKR